MKHVPNETLSKYARGTLSPSEFLTVDDHLTSCNLCREQLAACENAQKKSTDLQSFLNDAEPTDHLAYESLEAFVDGTADPIEQEIIESHLAFCGQCAEQVHEFKKVSPTAEAQRSAGQKILLLWNSPQYSNLFRTVSIAAIFTFFALILSLVIQQPDTNLQAQLDEANRKIDSAQQQIHKLNTQIAQLHHTTTQESVPLVASLNDSNGKVGIDENGRLIGVDHFSDSYKQLLRAALTEKSLPVPQWLKEIHGNSEVLMGESRDGLPIRLINPVGTVVESSRPLFQWQPLTGASGYRVSVYDQQFDPIVSSQKLATNSWSPSTDLPRGVTYLWKITATKDGQEISSPIPPAPEAKFKIVGQEDLQEITEARKSNSHLLLVLAYTKAGMISEAKSELDQVSTANPHSDLVENLQRALPAR
jgi:hypothetical protein